MNYTLEQAKEQVAKKRHPKYNSYREFYLMAGFPEIISVIEEASELYRLESNKEKDEEIANLRMALEDAANMYGYKLNEIANLHKELPNIWNRACEAQKRVCADKAETVIDYIPSKDEVQRSVDRGSIINAPNAPYQP